uniref:Uncharacterized protein n=1 Tax=Caenorhabditis japonica TaxID=281687 RepID=A0A8R1DVM2_CAEJA
MDRRRDGRYKQQQQQQQQQHESHHYDDRYNATYDNYDYEEDYGNQYANTVAHHHLPHPNALPHPPHPEDHGYEDEEDHWASQQQQDFYDTVPATNIPPVKPINQRNVARVQISTAQMPESENRNIPQAPPPPRFGPTGGYSNHNHNHNHHNNNNNSGNDRKSSKYGNVTIDHQKPRRDDVHIRFEAGAKREFPPKQTSFIDGFRSQDALPIGVPKKKEGGGSTGQPTNTIRSIINNLKGGGGGEKQRKSSLVFGCVLLIHSVQ